MKKSNQVFLVGIVILCLGIFSIFLLRLNTNQYNIIESIVTKSKRTKLIAEKGKEVHWSKEYSKDLTSFSLDGLFDVTIIQNDQNRVDVQTDENVVPYLRFTTLNGKLKIQLKPGYYVSPTNKVKIVINTSGPKKIRLIGNNSLKTNDLLSEYLILSTEGTNTIYLQGKVKNLDMNIAGRAQFHINNSETNLLNLKMIGEMTGFLTGNAEVMDIIGAGNVKLFAKDFKTNNIHVESIAANSEMILHAKKNLSITSIGKTNIKYYGNPTVKRNTIGTNNLQFMNK